jgi:hypothetical protein
VKRSGLGTDQPIFASVDGGSNSTFLQFLFGSADTLVVGFSSFAGIATSSLYRDTSAWYHIVLACDTTQASATNRLRLYVNGVEVTAFGTDGRSSITQNSDLGINQTAAHYLGRVERFGSSNYLSGYLADIYFIDGQQLTPSSFTETDATTGQLIPKAYTGSYGTNGFHLEFADNSSNTATTLGKDTSGNGNNFTPSNLSVTAGAGNDSLVDVPTNGAQTDTGVGGEVRGNYCTLNPLFKADTGTPAYSNGNLDLSAGGSGDSYFAGTFLFSTGKYYYETTINAVGNGVLIGVCAELNSTSLTNIGSYRESGTIYNLSSATQTAGSAYTTGDIIGVAIDCDNATVKFYKNGVGQGATPSFTFTAGTNLIVRGRSNSTGASLSFNFGQRAFAYTAPSGFKALCTANLPAPLVTKPSTVFDVKLWTGNGSSQTITGLGFSPDFVWIKSRSASYNHRLLDTIRGATKELYSSTTDAETTQSQSLTAFNSDGFSLGSLAQVNESSTTFAGWAWDAGSSTVTNTQGSITSSVRANATAGFSVVTYTGNGTAGATVGHGLGAAPALIINKQRSGTNNWWTYHVSLGATKYVVLDLTNAAATANTTWNDTAPTSTVFSIGVTGVTNTSSATYVSYCFAPVVGYSSFGSYTGNGSTDGPFVYTGFRPRWLLIKNASVGSDSWQIWDAARSDYNAAQKYLLPNTSGAEGDNSGFAIDFTANGFKVRNTNTASNGSGNTLVYAAFAEAPFNYARAR